MPKNIEISVLYSNFDIIKSVPSSYEEGDTLIGEIGGVLDGFVSDCTARNFLPRLYKGVSKQLVTMGYARKQVKEMPKKNGPPTPIFESEISHIGRVHDEVGPDIRATIGRMLQETAAEIPFYEKGERTGLGGKISARAMNTANGYFAEGEAAVENIATQIEELVPAYKVARDDDDAITPEGLARGIQALEKHAQKMALARLDTRK